MVAVLSPFWLLHKIVLLFLEFLNVHKPNSTLIPWAAPKLWG